MGMKSDFQKSKLTPALLEDCAILLQPNILKESVHIALGSDPSSK